MGYILYTYDLLNTYCMYITYIILYCIEHINYNYCNVGYSNVDIIIIKYIV